MPHAVNLRFGDTQFLLAFPMTGAGHHRLIGVVRTAADEEVTEAPVRATLERVFGVTYESALWFSTYRVHHRVAERFRQGPVFLAGDAAHVHSPVGAQGMNTGLQDAHNLACKIADVLRRGAPDAYLDRYEAERMPVARRLVGTTDTLFGVRHLGQDEARDSSAGVCCACSRRSARPSCRAPGARPGSSNTCRRPASTTG